MADGYSRPIPPKDQWTVIQMPGQPSKMKRFLRFLLTTAIMIGLAYCYQKFGWWVMFIWALCTASYIKGAVGW